MIMLHLALPLHNKQIAMLLHHLSCHCWHISTTKSFDENKFFPEQPRKKIERIGYHRTSCYHIVWTFLNPDTDSFEAINNHLRTHQFIFQICLPHKVLRLRCFKHRLFCHHKTTILIHQWLQFLQLFPMSTRTGNKTNLMLFHFLS